MSPGPPVQGLLLPSPEAPGRPSGRPRAGARQLSSPGTAPRGPRGPWGGRRRPPGPPCLQKAPGLGEPGWAAFRVPQAEAAHQGPRQRRPRRGSAGATGTRPRHGPTSLCPVPRCSDPDFGLCVLSPLRELRSAIRDFPILWPGSGIFYSKFPKFFTDQL